MVDQLYRAEIDAVTAAKWSELLGWFEDANIYHTWSAGNEATPPDKTSNF